MSTTLWVLSKNRMTEGDDYDHSALFHAVERLDDICKKLGVSPLSGFLDWTDFNANMSEDEDFPDEDTLRESSSWFSPDDAIPVFVALQKHLASSPETLDSLFDEDYRHMSEYLLEEMADCLSKLQNISSEKDVFHLCIVM